jgi:hypothetical protein
LGESESFAFGPVQGKRRAAPLGRVRAWAAFMVRGWRALAVSCLLFSVAFAAFLGAWTLLTVATARRAAEELSSRWAARYRARHREAAWIPALPAPGRHRLIPVSGRHRRPGLLVTLRALGRHRPSPVPRPMVSTVLQQIASWQPDPLRTARRWVRSRRFSTVLAVTITVFLLGGLLPVNAAPGDITTVAGRPDFGDRGTGSHP